MSYASLVRLVKSCLTDDLRRPPWKGSENRVAGHCYVACEALHHLTGGRLRPHFIRVNGSPHWFLRDENNKVWDPTKAQFKEPVRYAEGRGTGFLTKAPSARCRELLNRCKSRSAVVT